MEEKKECQYCIKYKTMYCPNSSECYSLINLPHFRTKMTLLNELQAYKDREDKLREWIDNNTRGDWLEVREVDILQILNKEEL